MDIHSLKVIKYPGIIVDEKFKWNNHIQYILTSIRTLFFIFRSLRCFLNSQMLKIVYFSLAQSIISYGISVWGRTYNIHLINIEVTIRTTKMILKKPKS